MVGGEQANFDLRKIGSKGKIEAMNIKLSDTNVKCKNGTLKKVVSLLERYIYP